MQSVYQWLLSKKPLWLRYSIKRILHPKAVFLIMTADHGNLGDHAIAEAETTILHEQGIPYIEIPGERLVAIHKVWKLKFMNGRPILVHGGGYLGTIWFASEMLLRDVIQQNPRSRIILLPNTMYYEDSPEGRKQFEKSVQIYNEHPNLTIYMRERTSYTKAKDVYCDVRLMPDMAMYLNQCRPSQSRSGCIVCLRDDREKTRTMADEQTLLEQIASLFPGNILFQDMCVDHFIPVSKRHLELEKQFNAFRSAELVLTDRLHGMIFCAITGTPCIFINSKSPKVLGCYEWLRNLDYIRFCEDPAILSDIFNSMPKGDHCYDNSHLMPFYDKLAREIKKSIGKL